MGQYKKSGGTWVATSKKQAKKTKKTKQNRETMDANPQLSTELQQNQSKNSSQENTSSCRSLPTMLPFAVQRKLLSILQRVLEEMCWRFGNIWCFKIMCERGWSEPFQLELTAWIGFIRRKPESIPSGAFLDMHQTTFNELLSSVAKVRHHAVHRKSQTMQWLLECLKASRSFAELHQDGQTAKQIDELFASVRVEIEDVYKQQGHMEAKTQAHLAELEKIKHCNQDLLAAAGTRLSRLLSTFMDQQDQRTPDIEEDDTVTLNCDILDSWELSEGLISHVKYQKKFPTQGLWQLYRLESSINFTCYQCNNEKKSCYIAYYASARSNPSCNQCYARAVNSKQSLYTGCRVIEQGTNGAFRPAV